MTRRGPEIPRSLVALAMIAGAGLLVFLVLMIFATVGEDHPLIGGLVAIWIAPGAITLPLAAGFWAWEKRHPGCFDEVDAREALMESSEA